MNRNDRKIATAAVVVATLAFVGLYLAGFDSQQATVPDSLASASLAATASSSRASSPGSCASSPGSCASSPLSPYDATVSHLAPERFPFDPNTADSTQLLRLGLRPWQVRNIYRYRQKGGIYRRKEDFAHLYGLTVKEYRELEPYIRISRDYLPASTLVGERPKRDTVRFERDTVRYPVKVKPGEYIVLNTADTAQLKRVPGIGSYYATAIVRYGRRLGGYVSIDQLDEIEDFPKDAKQYFVVQQPAPRKLNVNRLTLNELRRHPYVNYYQAKAILDYRRLHGNITSLTDLRFSPDFSDDAIRRLEPYVEY